MASADRSVVYTNKDQDYIDYVESFLIRDGDYHKNKRMGNPVKTVDAGK